MKVLTCDCNDIEEIYKISNKRIINSPLTLKDFKSYIQDSNMEILKLVDFNLSTIGYCILRYEGFDVEIDEIALKEEYEGKGFATFFLNYIQNYLKDKKLNNIFLEVRSKNSRAIKLYTKFGFKNYRIRKNYYINDDALCLVKELNI